MKSLYPGRLDNDQLAAQAGPALLPSSHMIISPELEHEHPETEERSKLSSEKIVWAFGAVAVIVRNILTLFSGASQQMR